MDKAWRTGKRRKKEVIYNWTSSYVTLFYTDKDQRRAVRIRN